MAKLEHTTSDGLFVDQWFREDDKVYRHRTQTNRSEILAENAKRRNEVASKIDGMRWALSIPADDYATLIKLNPELDHPDRAIQHRAWQRFMASPESMIYRVYSARRGHTA